MQKKLPVSTFGHVVIAASPWYILPYNLIQDISLSSPKLLTFSEIQDCGRHHLGSSSHVNLEHSIMLIV